MAAAGSSGKKWASDPGKKRVVGVGGGAGGARVDQRRREWGSVGGEELTSGRGAKGRGWRRISPEP